MEIFRCSATFSWRKGIQIHPLYPPPPPPTRAPQFWRGESLLGKSIAIRWEEGLGDTIQMLRYVGRLVELGAKVYVDVQKPLMPLASHIQNCIPIGTFEGESLDVSSLDYFIPVFSLPRLFCETLDKPCRPYLSVPKQQVSAWKRTFDGLPRPIIAFKWRGANYHIKNKIRSVDVGQIVSAFDGIGTLVSLQIDRSADEHLPYNVMDVANEDIVNTAAIMMASDVVVSICTSMAHLAGALGCPTLLLLSHDADWRWLPKNANNWYSSVTIHQQSKPGDWSAPLLSASASVRNIKL